MNLLPALPNRSLGIFLGLVSSVIAADDLPKDIATRLTEKWLAKAKQLQTPEHVIYYRGSAKGGTASDGKHWAGEIKGEILVLTRQPAVATTCSKVSLSPTGWISVEGKNYMKIADDVPPWKKHLEPRN